MGDGARLRAFGALCLARFREFYRESEVVFWSFIFPIILSFGLGLAFRNRPAEVLNAALVEGAGAAEVAARLRETPGFKVVILSEAEASRALTMGRVEVVVVAGPAPLAPGGRGLEYRLDPSRPEAVAARARVDDALQRAAGRRDPLASHDRPLLEPGGRYIDFLIPGIMGMNLMSGGMWGVGFNLVDMRIKKLLKRLTATPMHRADFMAAQMAVRVAFMALEVSFLLAFGRLAFGVPLRGSVAAVLVVGAVGALAFGGIGLLVASRARRIETVTGLMNVIMMPMFICSGIFFSADRFPDALQPVIRALPLTALNDALRAVILEGATLASQGGRLLLLAAWGGLSFAAGLRLFRWN
jgi:ABC-type multidrug transport system permease subunit